MTRGPSGLRILLVTPVSPFSLASGSEQRSALMLAALSRIGTVDVLILRPGETDSVTVDQRTEHCCVLAVAYGRELSLSRYHPRIELTRQIEQALGCEMSSYQLVLGRYVWPVCQLVIPVAVRVIVDLDDFRFRHSSQSRWTLASAKERIAKALTHNLARRQLQRFHGAFILSEQDRKDVSGLPTRYLPNVPMSSCEHPIPVPHNKVILFVGSLWYRPNVEGIDWFLLRVWPQVLALEPDATLILAGAAPKEVRAVWETYPGVSAPGFVSDLAATYQHANLVIVPLHSGGGTNIKVIEALAHGRPCLISSFVEKAFDGHLVHDADLLVADSAREFCAKTLLVLSANVNVQQIADSGRVAVRKYFTVDAFKTSVTDFVQLPLSSLP